MADGAGGAIVTWQQDIRTVLEMKSDYRVGEKLDIYAQHVLASGQVDPAWPADGRALCTAANNQYRPIIIADGAGGAIVAWVDNRNGGDAPDGVDIYAQRVQPNGQLGGTVVVRH